MHGTGNGLCTSFWYDTWSSMRCLIDITGRRGIVDLGIVRHNSIPDAWGKRRRKRHRQDNLDTIELNLQQLLQKRTASDDLVLWRGKQDDYSRTFSTKDTWHNILSSQEKVEWHNAVWFSHGTPKQSFCTWLEMRNMLSTGDRMVLIKITTRFKMW